MIPKKIHYVWPGRDEKNKLFKKCYQSWRDKLPDDWEFIEWNPDTFDFEYHRKINKFFDEVCKRNLYAFCADYIRTVVLYEYGGIYLDTDVTLLKPFSEDILNNRMFLPICNGNQVEPAVWGAEAKHPFAERIIEFYQDDIWHCTEYIMPEIFMLQLGRDYDIHRFNTDRTKQVVFTTDDGQITFYPEKYFMPFRAGEHFKPDCIEEETYTLHWYNGSWCNKKELEFLYSKCKDYYKPVNPNVQLFRKYFGFKYISKDRLMWLKLFGKKFTLLNKTEI